MSQEKRLTLADYLTYLEQKGIEKGYFEVYALKDIHTSCCNSATTSVIGFDKVKEKVVQEEDLKTVSSCDCMKILPENGRIDFIEMKRFKAFVERLKRSDVSKALDKQVNSFNFFKKIKDSLHILETLVRKNAFDRTTMDEVHFDNITINYIVLTDVDAEKNAFEYIASSFIFLAESSSIESLIESKINKKLSKIPKIRLNLNAPMLKTCSQIEEFYKNKHLKP